MISKFVAYTILTVVALALFLAVRVIFYKNIPTLYKIAFIGSLLLNGVLLYSTIAFMVGYNYEIEHRKALEQKTASFAQ